MNNIVSIKNLTISFNNNTKVVNDVNIEIPKGKTVAIVGESGSGKTLSALSILRLLPSSAKIDQGQIIFDRKDLLKLPLKEIEKIRGNRISTIFQEPMSSLNPLHKIDKQIKEEGSEGQAEEVPAITPKKETNGSKEKEPTLKPKEGEKDVGRSN